MFDAELETFKNIDLRAYAAGCGYQLDAKESWRGSSVAARELPGARGGFIGAPSAGYLGLARKVRGG